LTISANRKIAPGYYRIVMKSKSLARFSIPGQFCLLSVPGVFLRRPLSISAVSGNKIEFIYKVIGRGTENLTKLKEGSKIEVLGPLGSPYILKTDKMPLLIAGGTGVASLKFLAQKLKRPGVIFYGAKKKSEFVPLIGVPKRWHIKYSTEDGSLGHKGLVTDFLEKYLNTKGFIGIVVFACGPNPMLEKISRICEAYNIEAYVSLEGMMACGVGNCQGCAVKSGDTYKMVCKDGPVFKIGDVEI